VVCEGVILCVGRNGFWVVSMFVEYIKIVSISKIRCLSIHIYIPLRIMPSVS